MTAELGPTNVTIEAEDVIVPENMTPSMRLIESDGEVKFVVTEGEGIGYSK
jgi:hypothetical protein